MNRNKNPETLRDLIERAVERKRTIDLSRVEASDGLPADFRHTRAFEEIIGAIALGQRIRANLVLITGQNGGGKTTALRVYGKSVPEAVYWEARAGYEPKHVLQDIIAQLPIATGEGWRLQTSAAVEYLREKPRVFLLDEAQRLNYASLDLLKYIADNSGSMFVLSASNSLATRIEKWPDISSRCPVRIEVRPMQLDEFLEIYQVEGWSLEALTEIHRLSRGVMRTIQALFLVINDHLETLALETREEFSRLDVTAAHVRVIAAGVVPAQVASTELARRS